MVFATESISQCPTAGVLDARILQFIECLVFIGFSAEEFPCAPNPYEAPCSEGNAIPFLEVHFDQLIAESVRGMNGAPGIG